MSELFTEWFPGAPGLSFKVKQTLADVQSEYQHIQVFETETHGRMLVNDGCVMLTERDEAAYHEMLVHVPLLTHPEPKRVLVIGGGDGGTLREVIRHSTVTLARQVEIDGEVVRLSREHLPSLASAYESEKVDLILGDGVAFMEEAPENAYDVILVDSTDPFGPALELFGETFYRQVHRVLAPEGVMACQAESMHDNMEMLASITAALKGVFPLVRIYSSAIPTYPSGTWSFAFASKGLDPLKDAPDETRTRALEADGLNYWTRELHKAAFALPAFALRRLAPQTPSNKNT